MSQHLGSLNRFRIFGLLNNNCKKSWRSYWARSTGRYILSTDFRCPSVDLKEQKAVPTSEDKPIMGTALSKTKLTTASKGIS